MNNKDQGGGESPPQTAVALPRPPDPHFSAWPTNLERRREFIGGSDIAAIVGANPYRTVLDVWLDKRGAAEPFEGNEFTEAGTRLEGAIVEWFADKNPGLSIDLIPDSTWRDETVDYFAASPDAVALCPERGFGIGEAKNVNARLEKDWDGDAPDMHKIQALWNCGIIGAEWGFVTGLIGGYSLRSVQFDFDAELFDWLTSEAHKFWGHVESGTPPDAHLAHPLAQKSLNAVFPLDDDSGPVELDETAIKAHRDLLAAKADQKTAKTKAAEAQAALTQFMRTAKEATISGETAVTVSSYTRRSVDTDALQERWPDAHADSEIWRTTPVRRIDPKVIDPDPEP